MTQARQAGVMVGSEPKKTRDCKGMMTTGGREAEICTSLQTRRG